LLLVNRFLSCRAVAVGLGFWLIVDGAKGADDVWHVEGPVRWKVLPVASGGKTGFTSLPPEQTGVFFTNVLDEWSGAANRVLENGSGVAIGDVDGDGRPDIFLCSLSGQSRLYRNLGSWHFEDITSKAGIHLTNFICRGAVLADLNGDGKLDLLVSTLGHGVLCFLNNGTGGFSNVTEGAGTQTHYGSMTMTLADVDGNGTLDLYVANYRAEDIRDRARVEVRRVNGQIEVAPQLRDRVFLTQEGLMEFGEPDVLYLNDGAGHFTAVPWTEGRFLDEDGHPIGSAPMDWGLSAAFHDLNGDGTPDLYVCNDYWTPDRVWLNDGRGVFRAAPRLSLRHTSENSMGVDFADIDRDGQVEFLVLDMLSRSSVRRKTELPAQTKLAQKAAPGEMANRPQTMRNTLFHHRGDGTFTEIADYAGLAASDWSWQPVFLDVDLDGYEDLIIPAGHQRDVQDLDAIARIRSLQQPFPKDMSPTQRQEAFTRNMMEHVRLYPRLDMPIMTFRNRGDSTFEEVTASWGTGMPGVHQGIACGDLDGDGDLDFVVNNLNGVAGIYRNDGSAPRVAVRLKGQPPNTYGIGAQIKVIGGAVPVQSQEMICGGKYLSSDDPMRVFAAGMLTNQMRIEVTWRNGRRSVVADARPNRLYEIAEAETLPVESARRPAPHPIFEDVSRLLGHTHHEEDFDDFERQPLLSRQLSQSGPGVGWLDLDGSGHADLVIGSGKSGHVAVYHNDGRGGLEQMKMSEAAVTQDQTAVVGNKQLGILIGSAIYEQDAVSGPSVTRSFPGGKDPADLLPAWSASAGPLALGDLRGDGTLALFVGGRVIPGRYPSPATSRIYTNDNGTFKLAQELADVGLVSGAVWSDLDGDGFPELLLACDWGPVRVFHYEKGKLHEITQDLGLDKYSGWWNGVTTGDLDGDGRMDIVASNWGRNTRYEQCRTRPLRIYYGDFNRDGRTQLLEASYAADIQRYVPWQGLNLVAAALPWVRARFATHAEYAAASIEEVLGDRIQEAHRLEVNTFESVVFLNRGDHFELRILPVEAQLSPAFGICVGDYDGDGKEDLFLSQNFFATEPSTPRLDSGRGLWLHGDGVGNFSAVPGQDSGIQVYGEQRGSAICDYDGDGRIDLVVCQNGAETKLFHNVGGKPGLRVRLKGPPGNPDTFGAQLRLKFPNHDGPMREIHGGSGYWSQDSAVQVLATPQTPTTLWIRWPGGRVSSTPIPPAAKEISVVFDF
jgi:hypothetical protein